MGSARHFTLRTGVVVVAVTTLMTGFAPRASAATGFVSIGGATVVEGAKAAFDITLSEPSTGPVSVAWSTFRDTATPTASGRDRRFCNGDYQETAGTVTVPAGRTEKRVYVQTCGDLTSEPVPERFEIGLNIGSVTGGYVLGSHSIDFGTIIDRAPCGCNVQAAIGDVSLVEGNAGKGRYADFTVSLNQTSMSAVSIDYSVASDTATCGPVTRAWKPIDPLNTDCGNLNGATGTLVFPLVLGKTRTSSWIKVPIFADTNTGEGDETFTVTISNARNASGSLLITRDVGTGTIIDDD
jgi:hypothetical protein